MPEPRMKRWTRIEDHVVVYQIEVDEEWLVETREPRFTILKWITDLLDLS